MVAAWCRSAAMLMDNHALQLPCIRRDPDCITYREDKLPGLFRGFIPYPIILWIRIGPYIIRRMLRENAYWENHQDDHSSIPPAGKVKNLQYEKLA